MYEARNRPEISEVKKTIAIIAKVKPVSSGEIITKSYTKRSLSCSEYCDRIELFHRLCREGPTFICVVCNRCLRKKM